MINHLIGYLGDILNRPYLIILFWMIQNVSQMDGEWDGLWHFMAFYGILWHLVYHIGFFQVPVETIAKILRCEDTVFDAMINFVMKALRSERNSCFGNCSFVRVLSKFQDKNDMKL